VARLLVVRDKQTNGAVFSLTDLLDTATSNANYQGDDHTRYQILLDKRWDLGYVATAAGPTFGASAGVPSYSFYFKIPLNHKTQYNNGNAGTVADIDYGSIYMLWIGDVAASATLAATARCGVMCRYTDA